MDAGSDVCYDHVMTNTDTTELAIRLVNSRSHDEAHGHAAKLAGAALAAVAQRVGATVYGRVADRRKQLVQQAIGRVLDHAAIVHPGAPAERDALVEAYRQRRIAELTS